MNRKGQELLAEPQELLIHDSYVRFVQMFDLYDLYEDSKIFTKNDSNYTLFIFDLN